MTRWARKVDGNHTELVRQLRALGVFVHDMSRVGGGFPDLLCHARGRVVLLEVKDPRRPKSARKLSPAEAQFHALYPGPIAVVETLEEALEALGLKR